MRRTAAALALMAAVVVLAGCGSSAHDDAIAGGTLTIYSSVPMHGASRLTAEAVVGGERLALAQINDRIGRYRIVLRPLDDSTPASGQWDPGQTTVNARLAMQDKTTIGYLGELNSGASAISIPLLNRLGIPQVSPASTAVGLTSGDAGSSPGEPQKYYPTGARTYVRVVPNDAVQAVVQVRLQQSVGCDKTYVLDDGEVDGQDTATSFSLAAARAGLHVVGNQSFDPRASDYRSLAAGVAQTGANCVMISAITETGAVLISEQVAAALPTAHIFASAGLAESSFTDPAEGGIPAALDSRVLLTVATLDPGADPPAARAFYSRYDHAYGSPPPYAIFGYEAMSLLLSAIAKATAHGRRPPHRSKVVAAIFATRNRESPLGTYSIDRDGDTSLRRYGVYKVAAGRLAFWKAVDA